MRPRIVRSVRRLAVAALLTAAAGVGVFTPAPAQASVCSSASGVTVVVDGGELGGGVMSVCDPDGGGKSATALFTSNGWSLTYVQRQPGFVCRIDGRPAPEDDPCVNTPPADAYWGLFWSDGTSGSWSYASEGAGSLTVPDGGYVGFAWQGSSSKSPPGVTPRKHPSPTPTPSPSPTAHPTRDGGGGSGSGATTSASPTTSASASASSKPHRRHHQASARPSRTRASSPEPSPSGSTSAAAGEPTSAAADAEPPDGGLPGWAVPSVVVLLLGSAAGAAVVRRNRGAPKP